MTYRVRFTQEAEADLVRLYEFILDRDAADWALPSVRWRQFARALPRWSAALYLPQGHG
jgi:plasmid stabilization system protein ParE